MAPRLSDLREAGWHAPSPESLSTPQEGPRYPGGGRGGQTRSEVCGAFSASQGGRDRRGENTGKIAPGGGAPGWLGGLSICLWLGSPSARVLSQINK